MTTRKLHTRQKLERAMHDTHANRGMEASVELICSFALCSSSDPRCV